MLTGTEFDLSIEQAQANFTGNRRTAMTINGGIPGPILRWREGDTVTLRVRNQLKDTTSIHWHGIIVPANMDGVPGLSFRGIEPGGMYAYQFKVKQNGTYWYHSHSAFQEQSGVYGPLIIDAKDPEPFTHDRDYVVMLSDWTDEDPAGIARKLKKQADYYNFHKRTIVDFVRDVKSNGFGATVDDRMMWAEMRMNPTDLADVSGYTYTYLMNGSAPEPGWTGIFRRGERVRLRFINGSSMSYFDVRIPGLKMTVVAADGQHVRPVSVDEFRIAVAETYDVLVEPAGEDAYTIFAQSMDRTGYARGTLTISEGRTAPVPPMDPRPLVTMDDMGMGGMGHGSMGNMSSGSMAPQAGDHGSMQGKPNQPSSAGTGDMQSMDHSKMTGMPSPMQGMDHSGMSGMDHGNMQGMDHSQMNRMDHSQMQGMQGMDHGNMEDMDHSQMQGMQSQMKGMDHGAMPGMNHSPTQGMQGMDHGQMQGMGGMQSHRPSEDGNPLVDMQAMSPVPKLDDPGMGLRDNGRRVLTYADLRSTFEDPDGREPSRTIELHLTGHMEKFVWSFDGIKFSDAEPVPLKYGERVRIVLVNDTMMSHPIHLHGMWSDLEDEQGNFLVRKHTIDMPPGSKRSYRVTADALGRWAYHCHLLYHMEMGMFREVRVQE